MCLFSILRWVIYQKRMKSFRLHGILWELRQQMYEEYIVETNMEKWGNVCN